jgi:hypothetical protein
VAGFRLNPGAGNGEVRTVHAAQIAATAFFRGNNVRRMVTLGVEGRGKRKYMRRTELDAESASLATLHFDLDSTLWWHEFLKRNWIAPMCAAKA